MNRTILTSAIAEQTGVPKSVAERALAATLDAVAAELARGGKVTLAGFGTLRTVSRQPRMGRDPRTGLPIRIAARNSVCFVLSPELKAAVNTRGFHGR